LAMAKEKAKLEQARARFEVYPVSWSLIICVPAR
jgi:hypothetical protein